jgi:hypothetical protein
MTENEIIIANLKAQIMIEEAREKASRNFAYNNSMQVQASVCEYTAKYLKEQIRRLTK